ncbi:hypothetical protein M0813_27080 [Anaeramoeba flamelloides]|uniref:Uncharacterized protein n=1 Tax=Anaeramoeba flamelloides TaxID=1746091 RepID=A0ABQ8XY36_9EUKA|nr:hypothetical protein M0813_27080 [Anaeramoeba flamelloides]
MTYWSDKKRNVDYEMKNKKGSDQKFLRNKILLDNHKEKEKEREKRKEREKENDKVKKEEQNTNQNPNQDIQEKQTNNYFDQKLFQSIKPTNLKKNLLPQEYTGPPWERTGNISSTILEDLDRNRQTENGVKNFFKKNPNYAHDKIKAKKIQIKNEKDLDIKERINPNKVKNPELKYQAGLILKKLNLWEQEQTTNKLPKWPEYRQPFTVFDLILQKIPYLSIDFQQERVWKKALFKILAEEARIKYRELKKKSKIKKKKLGLKYYLQLPKTKFLSNNDIINFKIHPNFNSLLYHDYTQNRFNKIQGVNKIDNIRTKPKKIKKDFRNRSKKLSFAKSNSKKKQIPNTNLKSNFKKSVKNRSLDDLKLIVDKKVVNQDQHPLSNKLYLLELKKKFDNSILEKDSIINFPNTNRRITRSSLLKQKLELEKNQNNKNGKGGSSNQREYKENEIYLSSNNYFNPQQSVQRKTQKRTIQKDFEKEIEHETKPYLVIDKNPVLVRQMEKERKRKRRRKEIKEEPNGGMSMGINEEYPIESEEEDDEDDYKDDSDDDPDFTGPEVDKFLLAMKKSEQEKTKWNNYTQSILKKQKINNQIIQREKIYKNNLPKKLCIFHYNSLNPFNQFKKLRDRKENKYFEKLKKINFEETEITDNDKIKKNRKMECNPFHKDENLKINILNLKDYVENNLKSINILKQKYKKKPHLLKKFNLKQLKSLEFNTNNMNLTEIYQTEKENKKKNKNKNNKQMSVNQIDRQKNGDLFYPIECQVTINDFVKWLFTNLLQFNTISHQSIFLQLPLNKKYNLNAGNHANHIFIILSLKEISQFYSRNTSKIEFIFLLFNFFYQFLHKDLISIETIFNQHSLTLCERKKHIKKLIKERNVFDLFQKKLIQIKTQINHIQLCINARKRPTFENPSAIKKGGKKKKKIKIITTLKKK